MPPLSSHLNLEVPPGAAQWARIAAGLLAVWMIGACVYVMLARLGYPFELEWMTGFVLDHVDRLRQGAPLYTRPSASWIPFLYPPLYYWAAAQLPQAMAGHLGCRLISIAATFLSAACVARLSRRAGASGLWTLLAVGLFFAAYSVTDYWYDLERCDSLFVAMVLGGTLLLAETTGAVGAATAGLVAGAAFFAKQPAPLFVAGGVAALCLRREWIRALAYGGVAAAVVVAGIAKLDATSDGWFSYYVLRMPQGHGVSARLLPSLLGDLPRLWLLLAATAASAWSLARRDFRERIDVLVACQVCAAFAASVGSRLHVGGWANVWMFWTSFAPVAVAVAGTWLEASALRLPEGGPLREWGLLLLPALLCAQYATWLYAPARQIPSSASVVKNQAFVDLVRELEKSGEILVVGRGHVASTPRFHMAGLLDVVTFERDLPQDVVNAFRERRFAAVIIDSFDDLWMPLEPQLHGKFFQVVYANYFVARRLDPDMPAPMVGWSARPSFLLLPRRHPLDERQREALRRRSVLELRPHDAARGSEPSRAAMSKEAPTHENLAAEPFDRPFGEPAKTGTSGTAAR